MQFIYGKCQLRIDAGQKTEYGLPCEYSWMVDYLGLEPAVF